MGHETDALKGGRSQRAADQVLMYPKLLELIKKHRSTIVFGNRRGTVERLAHELAGRELTPCVTAPRPELPVMEVG